MLKGGVVVSFEDTAKERWQEEYCTMNETNRRRGGKAWYILDEIATKHSANHNSGRPCPICVRVLEAMRLLKKPYPEECREFYDERNESNR